MSNDQGETVEYAVVGSNGLKAPTETPCKRCGGSKQVQIFASQPDREWQECPECSTRDSDAKR